MGLLSILDLVFLVVHLRHWGKGQRSVRLIEFTVRFGMFQFLDFMSKGVGGRGCRFVDVVGERLSNMRRMIGLITVNKRRVRRVARRR